MNRFFSTFLAVFLFSGSLLGTSGEGGLTDSLEGTNWKPQNNKSGREALKVTNHRGFSSAKEVVDIKDSSTIQKDYSGEYEAVYQAVKFKPINPIYSDTEETEENKQDSYPCTLKLKKTNSGNYQLSDFIMDMRSESYINLQEYSGKKRQSPYSWGEPEQCLFLFLTGIVPNREHTLKPIEDHPNLPKSKDHFAVRYDENRNQVHFKSYNPVPYYPRDIAHLRLMFDPTSPEIADLYMERPPEQRTTKFSDSNSIGGKVFHFVLRKTGDED